MTNGIEVTVKRPSALSPQEIAAWHGFMAATPALSRAFLAPGFARACETALYRARVAVLRDADGPCAFLPFQFASTAHRLCGAAEPIGGGMADHAGIVARPGFRIAPEALLRRCGLGALYMRQLSPGQGAFGLAAEDRAVGHVIDLSDGPEAYLAGLAARDRAFVQDTERRARRLEKEYGPVAHSLTFEPPEAEVASLIEAKRAQYERTEVGDPLADPLHRRLMHVLAAQGDAHCRAALFRLTAGGTVIARHLGLMHGGVLSYWFPVYAPEARRVSPGRMLLWQTIRHAQAHGITLIDRGGGDSEAKRDFSTGQVQFGQALWRAHGPRGMLARTWQAAAWRLGR